MKQIWNWEQIEIILPRTKRQRNEDETNLKLGINWNNITKNKETKEWRREVEESDNKMTYKWCQYLLEYKKEIENRKFWYLGFLDCSISFLKKYY